MKFFLPSLTLTLLISLGSIPSHAQTNIDRGLVAYYQFENNVTDCSKNDYNGTIYGNPLYISGKKGLALDFNGTTDFIEIANSDTLILKSFTISTWVRWDGKPDAIGSWAIISNWFGGSNYQHYGLRMGTIQPNIAYNHPVIFYDDGTEWDWVYGYDEEFSDGNWHLVTGTLKSGEIAKIYLDGNVVAEDTSSIPEEINPTGNLYIARDGYGEANESHVNVKRWNGAIDEVRIYDRVLSSEEIKELYNGNTTFTKNIATNNKFITTYYDPTKDYIKINSTNTDGYNVKLINISGNIINQLDFKNGITIPTSNLQNGIYLLMINNTKTSMIEKIIINK